MGLKIFPATTLRLAAIAVLWAAVLSVLGGWKLRSGGEP